MFFDDLDQIPSIALKNNFSIFVLKFPDTGAQIFSDNRGKVPVFFLTPEKEKSAISVNAVRKFTALVANKQSEDRLMVVCPAEAMNEAAENAFLKHLEEPKEHIHFVLLTSRPSVLLPTILSRAAIYFEREKDPLGSPVAADEGTRTAAKRLITAGPSELIKLADELHKKKGDNRAFALSVVSAAIEIIYKSYFATSNQKLLIKLPNLLTLYDNLQHNGHIKLHVVADMI